MIPNFPKRFVFFFVLAAACLSSPAQKMTPSAPVKNFKLPMFGEDGYKIWDLQGREGHYLGRNHIKVSGMKLRTWTGKEPLRLNMTIESQSASIFPQDNRATGEEYIYILEANGGYSIVGRDWEWDGNRDRILVKKDARVTFKQSMGDILK